MTKSTLWSVLGLIEGGAQPVSAPCVEAVGTLELFTSIIACQPGKVLVAMLAPPVIPITMKLPYGLVHWVGFLLTGHRCGPSASG